MVKQLETRFKRIETKYVVSKEKILKTCSLILRSIW